MSQIELTGYILIPYSATVDREQFELLGARSALALAGVHAIDDGDLDTTEVAGVVAEQKCLDCGSKRPAECFCACGLSDVEDARQLDNATRFRDLVSAQRRIA